MRENYIKKGLAALLACLLLVTAAGCGGKPAVAAQAVLAAKEAAGPTVGVMLTQEIQGNVSVQTAVPVMQGFLAAETLNTRAAEMVEADVSMVRKAADEMAAAIALDDGLETTTPSNDYPYIVQSYFDWSRSGSADDTGSHMISLCVTVSTYAGGAHGFVSNRSITVDEKTGREYTLPELFNDPQAANAVIEKKILGDLAQNQMALGDVQATLTEQKGEFPYYLDGSNLVVYFNPYEVAPYAAGIPTFAFDLTKMDTVIPFENTRADAVFRLNGAPYPSVTPIFGENILLPVADMDRDGTWAKEDDSHWSIDGKRVETQSLNGKDYLPMDFFTKTLGQFIVYDGKHIRMYD